MRVAWVALGFVCLIAGVIGIFLPLLPTTPFLLLAAYAFSRGSDRLHAWLLRHPRLGPPIHNWQKHGAISTRAKALALISMVALLLISYALSLPGWVLGVQGGVLLCVSLFIVTRPRPPGR